MNRMLNPRTLRPIVATLLTCGFIGVSSAADMTIGDRPKQILVWEDEKSILVQWGSAGSWKRIKPDRIRDEMWEFRNMLSDRVVQESIREIVATGIQTSHRVGERWAQAEEKDWYTKEYKPKTERLLQTRVREIDLPPYLAALEWDIRATSVLVMYDDGDPWQRRWLEDWMYRAPRGNIMVMAVGWKNREDLLTFSRKHPSLTIGGVPEGMLDEIGVKGLPAFISFPTQTTMRYEEGYDVDTIVAHERLREAAASSTASAVLDSTTR